MSAPTAGQGIRALFGVVLDCLDDPRTPSRLCMLAAMLSEDVLADPDLRQRVEAGMSKLQARIADRIEQDRADGVLAHDLDLQVAATTYLQGLWRMAMVAYDRPRIEAQVDRLLDGLGLQGC